jgi:hydrogenase maturation factor
MCLAIPGDVHSLHATTVLDEITQRSRVERGARQ